LKQSLYKPVLIFFLLRIWFGKIICFESVPEEYFSGEKFLCFWGCSKDPHAIFCPSSRKYFGTHFDQTLMDEETRHSTGSFVSDVTPTGEIPPTHLTTLRRTPNSDILCKEEETPQIQHSHSLPAPTDFLNWPTIPNKVQSDVNPGFCKIYTKKLYF